MFDGVDIQDTLTVVALGTESKLADSEFRVGCASKWFEVVVGITLLIGYDLVKLVGNAGLCMLVEPVIGSLCRRAELPAPLVITHRHQRCPRG